MYKYCLDVTGSVEGVAADGNLNRLIFALDAFTTTHGGKVLEPTDAFSNVSYHRQCVDLVDCGGSFAKELDWLQKEFPDVLFGLAQMMTAR